MTADEFLKPDRRWEIWKCFTHLQYLDRFFLPARFHNKVPEKVQEAYKTVERLISYSYFYYPLTEEVHSKITRVFEMAVRLRATQLNITSKPTSPLAGIINKFKQSDDFDDELIEALHRVRKLRNTFAHPEGLMYWGPIGYTNVIGIINIINRLFIPVNTFHEYITSGNALKEKVEQMLPGLAIFDDGITKYLIYRAMPLMVNPSKAKSVWLLLPVLLKFPQNLDEYKEYKPFVLTLTQLVVGETGVEGYNTDNSSTVKMYPTNTELDIDAFKNYEKSYTTSDEEVKRIHGNMGNQTFFEVIDRFLYEEFWS